MKKALYRTLLVTIPLILFLISLELYCEIKIPNSYKLKRTSIEKYGNKIKILVLGDSHAWNGVNPDQFRQFGFNLSNPTQDIYENQKLLSKTIEQMPNLKIVLYALSYHTIGYKHEMVGYDWRFCLLLREFSILPENPAIIATKYDFCSYLTKEGKDPFMNLAFWKKNMEFDYRPSVVRENGWAEATCPNGVTPDAKAAQDRVKSHEGLINPALFPINVQRLKEMNQDLNIHKAKLVFITLPISKYFYQYMTREKYNSIQEEISRLTQEENIPYYNYIADNRFEDKDFCDFNHLNNAGANKISQIINKEVILPNLSPNR